MTTQMADDNDRDEDRDEVSRDEDRDEDRLPIGIGTPLAGSPSLITDRTDHVISDSAVIGRLDQEERGQGIE